MRRTRLEDMWHGLKGKPRLSVPRMQDPPGEVWFTDGPPCTAAYETYTLRSPVTRVRRKVPGLFVFVVLFYNLDVAKQPRRACSEPIGRAAGQRVLFISL